VAREECFDILFFLITRTQNKKSEGDLSGSMLADITSSTYRNKFRHVVE
jgi:hypothetical protein